MRRVCSRRRVGASSAPVAGWKSVVNAELVGRVDRAVYATNVLYHGHKGNIQGMNKVDGELLT